MDDLKKLYALLAILIVIYVGINFAYNGLDTLNTLSKVNLNVGLSLGGNDGDSIAVGNSTFAKLENFKEKKVEDREVRLIDSKHNMTIRVRELLDIHNLSDEVNKEITASDSNITSNQTVSQNGITAYFLYKEHADNYDARIFFTKNNQDYFIGGTNISYKDSDYFINNCKDIINSMSQSGTINYSRY